MSENTLVAKIKADTEQQVAKIKAESQEAVAAIEAETDKNLEAMRAAHQAAIKKQHDHLELVAVSRAKQEGKIALQQARRDQIDAIFAEAENELIAQPTDSYVAYFAKVVTEQVPSEANITTVLAPKTRVEETNKILAQAGLSGKVETDNKIKAGLLIKTESGVYDVTLNRLMNEARAELEMEIVEQVSA